MWKLQTDELRHHFVHWLCEEGAGSCVELLTGYDDEEA